MAEFISVLKETDNLLTNPKIIKEINSLKPFATKVVSKCILTELPIPCLSESVNFLNSYATADSPANLIQA